MKVVEEWHRKDIDISFCWDECIIIEGFLFNRADLNEK